MDEQLASTPSSRSFASPSSHRRSSPLRYSGLPDPDSKKALHKLSIARKKSNQWECWRSVTIPALITPYMDYLARTLDKESNQSGEHNCTCGGVDTKTSQVLLVYIDRDMDVHACSCTSAACYLVSRGFFPCAPVAPSVAFDMNMMELVSTLFLRVAPSITAWASTLETFLGARHFKLRTRHSVRRCLGNALNWYTHLVNCVQAKVTSTINEARLANAGAPMFTESQSQPAPSARNCEAPSQTPKPSAQPECHPSTLPPGLLAEGERPSTYLRSRCPLCFSASKDDACAAFDAIVCVDACFSQKRRAGPRDPQRSHPDSVFVPEADVQAMEKLVSIIRGSSEAARKSAAPDAHPNAEPDKCEGPLQVPNSVLDGCESSFKAADKRREKASTTFFSDTGLMAMICRHDCVLWLVNMTSASERQHYVLTLIQRLFQHIPTSWRIGLLYDIGCQIHRSIYKWGFLLNIRDRITFAISVFHAYGHQWPCQTCYHPRKCKGFGLCDGEGCERCWSALSHLVANLRSCGYFQRLYILDCQVHHLERKHLHNLGTWLMKKYESCLLRLSKAQKELLDSGVHRDKLLAEWTSQCLAQTKPMPRQSKNAGAKYVEAILTLEDRIRSLDTAIAKAHTNIDAHDLTQALESQMILEDEKLNAQKKLVKYESFLDGSSRNNLQALRKDQFLGRKANALALKTRIRDKLRQRKFEISLLQGMRIGNSSGRKLHEHTTSAIGKREPAIQAVVKKYNALCSEMDKLIKKGQAPPGAASPTAINLATFWSLDVDDPIWQDAGLLDDDDGSSSTAWLTDEKVRKGIRAMLEVDRCHEELTRIRKERGTMQSWLREEWATVEKVQSAISECTLVDIHLGPGMRYQLQVHRERLLQLAVVWRRRAGDIPSHKPQPESWGPS
ncbi:hypothetical protein PUNSTDRAFT_67722, partial [Punctularia strigosozonata HHB-11173 SS5]|uniref:uncharacterized protein n=1 Tax=Punctularia strigosozonata (strain HHB-11173) TaxID=741275 RepID=UPI00044169F9